MKRFGFIIATAVLLCVVGTTAPAYAQQQDQQDEKQAKQKEQAQPEKQQGQAKSAQQQKQEAQGEKAQAIQQRLVATERKLRELGNCPRPMMG